MVVVGKQHIHVCLLWLSGGNPTTDLLKNDICCSTNVRKRGSSPFRADVGWPKPLKSPAVRSLGMFGRLGTFFGAFAFCFDSLLLLGVCVSCVGIGDPTSQKRNVFPLDSFKTTPKRVPSKKHTHRRSNSSGKCIGYPVRPGEMPQAEHAVCDTGHHSLRHGLLLRGRHPHSSAHGPRCFLVQRFFFGSLGTVVGNCLVASPAIRFLWWCAFSGFGGGGGASHDTTSSAFGRGSENGQPSR